MKILKISIALFSLHSFSHTTSLDSAQIFLKNALEILPKYQNSLAISGFSMAVAGYLGYAIYLDGVINDTNSLWHWSLHHIHDGAIDKNILFEHIAQRYPDFKTLHPLAAIWATTFATQTEIETCLSLRGILKSLKNLHLEWFTSETIERLDKKLESLYILKITLAQCTLELRSRSKKIELLL
ncbi:MAG: hypothetical protein K2X90_01820 [Candidatus Babeliaceae bacterium]|nr:hypothetical protein [Candidatus Babeliaceae bacterium]